MNIDFFMLSELIVRKVGYFVKVEKSLVLHGILDYYSSFSVTRMQKKIGVKKADILRMKKAKKFV